MLAAWLGPAYGRESLSTAHHERDSAWIARFRAFPIPHLISLVVDAQHPLGVMEAVIAALTAALPGVTWGGAADSRVAPVLRALHMLGIFRAVLLT